MHIEDETFDFKGLGAEIKRARESKNWTRAKLAEILDVSDRHIMAIENKGKHPSVQLLYKLVRIFNISVDQFFHNESNPNQNTSRRQLNVLLDDLTDTDLLILEATTKAILESKKHEI